MYETEVPVPYTTDYTEFLAGLGAVFYLFVLAISVLFLAAYWIIFKKAGEHGWASIVPLYSSYVFYKIAFGNGWLFLLSLLPVLCVVMPIIATVKLGKAFGKGTGFIVGLIFLPAIFYPILAFGSSEYEGLNA